MAGVNHKSTIGKQLADLRQAIAEVRKKVGLGSATISGGSLTVQGGGSIGVQDGGNLTVQNGGSFEALAADGTPLVQISSADGTAEFSGQLSSGGSGDQVIVNPTGTSAPEIRFVPGSDPANAVRLRGLSSGDLFGTATPSEVAFQIASGIDPSNAFQTFIEMHAGYLFLAVNDATGTNTGAGGQLKLYSTEVAIGYVVAVGPQAVWTYDASGITSYLGLWDNYADRGANQGLMTAKIAGTASSSTDAVSFGTTKASGMTVMTNVFDNVLHPNSLTALTTSGFTITISPAASGAWTLMFWAFRL